MAEILLQNSENLFLKHTAESNAIIYYARYVDNIFFIYNNLHTTVENIFTSPTSRWCDS
jgi:hypothetical protein